MAHYEQIQKLGAKTRVLLVDAHVVVRQGITALLNQEADLIVCGSVSTTPAALEVIPKLLPDLIITDITLKNGNGLEVIKILAAQHSHIPVLVLTKHDESLYAEIALRS